MIILFDLDGTLIESTQAILESFHNSFRVHGFREQDDEKIKSLIGHPLDVMYRELGVEEERVWDFVATYKEYYSQESMFKTQLLPHARDSLELASSFASLGIVTTKTGKYSKILMEYFGVMEYFEVLIGREDVERPKPDAEPIEEALKHFDTKGQEIWMIGDTRLDILSAQNASINSIAVLSGYETKESLSEFTNIIFSDIYEAVKWLKGGKLSHY